MKKIVFFILLMLPVTVMGQSILYDVTFERRIDMLNLEGKSYDSVRVKFDVGDVLQETVKVTMWNKKGKRIYRHTFKKMNCVRDSKDFDDNVIIVGKPSIYFLVIKKCDDGPKFCVVREREGITKDIAEYLVEYYRKSDND